MDSGVMDAGNHFKNGASSKSQMSRANFLKLMGTLFAACLIFSLPGCDKDDDDAVVKLLETVEWGWGRSYSFEYDSQNRLTKITTSYVGGGIYQVVTLTYDGKLLLMH